ncbi:hypothetical protein SARC_08263 [Sphaeroforma arctica JP610]|uniref:VWFA domain-containing protein n=1 Tax=Sphaeroforma arctica JP610 TaxID=667725 RepID=A0A0L0FRY1_9EUKA|nr:hypothetical protein SARC_08263 [Sphaeroforma arctica JP610]KNC79341.1 hypothetical protein SARC_08263 [Sphaeroforma arctica JP610]|eukprot:XP_014153243.1 hypothetical protein SARC_08263 [Sphaeroforma arctica JP610]
MYSFNPSTEENVDANHTVLCLVTDRSESMEMMEGEVVTGINSYLEEQRRTNATDNLRTTLVFVRFNHMPELVWSGVDLRYLRPVVYSDALPRGSTALHDGIAEGMKHTCELLQRLPSLPSKVIMFILTDGEENSSRSWNADQIALDLKNRFGGYRESPHSYAPRTAKGIYCGG